MLAKQTIAPSINTKEIKAFCLVVVRRLEILRKGSRYKARSVTMSPATWTIAPEAA